MKYLSVITVFCVVFNLSANSNELESLESYASENNYYFDGLDEIKNPKEFMFNMSLRCAGLWSSLNDLEFTPRKELLNMIEVDDFKQAIQIYTDDFSKSLLTFEDYQESMLIRMKNIYKKTFENNLKTNGDYLEGKIGLNDTWSCTKFYADILGYDIESFVKNADPNKPILEQEIPRKKNRDVKTTISHIELWDELHDRFYTLMITAPNPDDVVYMDDLISAYCIEIHDNPVCPYVDSRQDKFDKSLWNQINEAMIAATAMGNGKILGLSRIEWVKHSYCVQKYATTRCFEGH